MSDGDLHWSWGHKTLRIDGPTVIVTDSQSQPSTQTLALWQAFDDPGRLFIDPPEVYGAAMRALAARLDDSSPDAEARRPRRAFWSALLPEGCAPLAVSWTHTTTAGQAPKTVTLDLAGLVVLGTAPPPDGYVQRNRQMIDDLFFYGPLEIGIPAAVRGRIVSTILGVLAPGSGVDERDAFPEIDHTRIAKASWTWGKADDGESAADVGGPAVISGYQYGHDFGWGAYPVERVATRAPGLYLGAPSDITDAIVAAVRAAIVSPRWPPR